MSEQGHTNSPDPSNQPVVLLESIVDIAKTHIQESDEGINDMLVLDYGGITYSGHSIRVDAYSRCDMKDRYVSMCEIISGTHISKTCLCSRDLRELGAHRRAGSKTAPSGAV